MARPRTYETKEALDRATRLFWEKGYDATSMAELVEVTGVSRYAFYSEFGDKEKLFKRCMEHYARTFIAKAVAPMERTDASLADIRAYFERLVTSVKMGNRRGCLIGNAAVSTPDGKARVAEVIEQHYTRLHDAFSNALENALDNGELSTERPPAALADYLVGVVNGYLANVRSGVPLQVIENYVSISLDVLT